MNAYKTYINIEDSAQLVLSNLPFKPGQRVEVIVLPVAETYPITQISQTGIIPPSGQWDREPISEAEFRQLVDRISPTPGKPLSEIIIEERGS